MFWFMAVATLVVAVVGALTIFYRDSPGSDITNTCREINGNCDIINQQSRRLAQVFEEGERVYRELGDACRALDDQGKRIIEVLDKERTRKGG